jgi:hypothetical protein
VLTPNDLSDVYAALCELPTKMGELAAGVVF